jgi:hypothetical protein
MNTKVTKEYNALLALYQAQNAELQALKEELEQLKRMLPGSLKESFRPAQEEAGAEGPPQGGDPTEEGARLENHPQKSMSELLPGNWRPPPPQVVQTKSTDK